MAEPVIRGRFFDLQHVNLWDAAHLDGGANRGQGSGVRGQGSGGQVPYSLLSAP